MDSSSIVVLTIAGSDPSGGAGVQADLKTFAAHRCYGASVLTALTAQNTVGVEGVHSVPPDFVEQQLKLVVEDLDICAIKTGMLFDSSVIKTVVRTLTSHYSQDKKLPLVVCDPVCVSTSGHTLLLEDALDALVSDLFPISSLITPNKSEAELLLSKARNPGRNNSTIETVEDMLRATTDLLELSGGTAAVLLKGGHIVASISDIQHIADSKKYGNVKILKQHLLDDSMEILLAGSPNYDTVKLVVDVLHERDGSQTLFVRPRIDSKSTHGTGCTLSSAVAAELARGCTLAKAVEEATMYTHLGIQAASSKIGHGHGPLNHLHNISFKTIPKPSPTNPYPFARLLIESTKVSWKEYVEHDFVVQLGKGTLDKKHFIYFIKQDYLYLKYYARAYGLLAAKTTSFSTIASATQTILNILHEIGNHKAFCATFGITEEELEGGTPESSATTAYGTYLIDMGVQGDVSKLTMALMACLLGYGEVGLWLKKQSTKPGSWVVLEGNPYRHWMEEYSGTMYQGAVKIGLDTIEVLAVRDPPSEARFAEWKSVWERCTRLEKGFWDAAMELGS